MNKQNSNQIKGRQSNHGDFYLPVCLSHLGKPPLYMAVAYWGLLKKTPFTRDDLSTAFHITVRRAADVMTYIYSERQNCITSRKSLVSTGSGHSCLYLQILAVIEPAPLRQAYQPPERRRISAYNKEGQQELWHWLLTRPVKGDTE
ncbi:CaiF/GrlA family transcriptional regulator [Yersinia thracica]|uniref:CaiF/GrlA family transcriptional regulator n=1 Tax=Yersinia thracica TaxID=2890319 RepID=UPI0011A3C5B2|nr:CaiF/GrlA family transcriptional regulator [Yersinia thracica]